MLKTPKKVLKIFKGLKRSQKSAAKHDADSQKAFRKLLENLTDRLNPSKIIQNLKILKNLSLNVVTAQVQVVKDPEDL